MPDPIDLEALEAKAKAATAGPWMLDGMGEDEPEINYWAHLFIGTAEPNESGSHEVIATSEDKHGPNGEFIAAAHPAVVLALITELRTARATIQNAYNAWHMETRSDAIDVLHEYLRDQGVKP